MKKKIVSFLTMLCLVLPCFFAAGCKDKKDEPKTAKAYTYSVVLKNAKGKIDENALRTEYDYKKQENVSWINTDNDYTVSVTRTSAISDSLSVSLLEGFDYSNLSFSVNSKDAEAEVISGTKTGCEKEAYLTDRQFHYEYSDMKADTELVVDFSECEWAKITLDFEELESQGIACYTTASDFVTINDSIDEALEEVTETTVEVDYGTIFAFDCAQKLVFKPETAENFQALSYAKYASKYYLGNGDANMVQYFTAKQDGDCLVYNAVKDYSKRGTLRILDCTNLPAYSSLEDLEACENALETQEEKESYGGQKFDINVIAETEMFMKLDESAKAFNYYVVDSIDGKMEITKLLEQKELGTTGISYLDINIANADGTAAAAKYLVRAPKAEVEYYLVETIVSSGDIVIKNADYVLIGRENINDNMIPNGNNGNVFYGFKNTKSVEIELSPYTSDINTDFVLSQNSVAVTTTNKSENGTTARTIGPIVDEPVTTDTKEIACYDEGDEFKFYEISVSYDTAKFSKSYVTLDSSDFELFEGEKVYYTTDISDNASWKLLTNTTELTISSEQTKTIYYYFDSDRTDAFLQIQNPTGSVVSLSGEIRDCFGRQMTGTITVGDFEINCSKIRYLDIKPGNYSSYTAKLIREFDKTYHNINLSGLGENTLMVSVGTYTANGSSFKNVSTLENFNIKYNSQEIGGTIYYYFNSSSNKHLVLKDASGNVVSTNTHVMESGKELQIAGNYVYRLALIGDYYDEDEVFTLEVVEATYGLKNSSNAEVEFFSDANMTEKEDVLVEGNEYYFVGEEGENYDIEDALGNTIVGEITMVVPGLEAVYKFTFELPAERNYVSGTSFKLVIKS